MERKRDIRPELLEDVLDLIGDKPVLFNDLVASLRGGTGANRSALAACPSSGRRWNINPRQLELALADADFHFATAPHGCGVAIYVADAPFTEVVNGRGKTIAVKVLR